MFADHTAGQTWKEARRSVLTPGQIAESDFRMHLIHQILTRRKSLGLSRRQLASLCGVRLSVITSLEDGSFFPDISDLLKILYALKLRLTITDL